MRVLIAITSGFASGVFLRSLFIFRWEPIAFAFLLAALLGTAAFWKPRLAYSLGAVFCLFVAFGMLRASLADTPLPSAFTGDLKQRVSYDGIVVADPDVRDANQRVEVRVSNSGTETKILVVAPRYPSIMVGDSVNVSGTLLVPEPFSDDGGRVFRYDKYLERDGVRFILNFAFIRVTRPAPWYSIPAALARVKHLFLDGLSSTLPEPYASLAGGVVIGGKSGLGKDLQDAFVRSGLVQIIVLSGYNVMVVAEWIMAALASMKISRRWSSAAGAIAILIFIGIAGASATALRAMFMAFIALYARATGRSYSASRALLFVVILMLMWNPLYLVFDPGFGLSVAATAGLIWLAPVIEKLLQERGERFLRVMPSAVFPSGKIERSQESFSSNGFWLNAVATTLAAQVAVLPLLLYDTGNLSFVAIPANLLTMPIVPLAMGLSALAGFSGMLFHTALPIVGIVLAYPAYLANAYLIVVAQKAATFPFAAFTLPLFPFWLVLVAYATLIYIVASKRFSTTLQLRFAKKASI
ncbi:MAG: ComEC/Rec2 family competence protein [Candidatus Paceibacteria bacterium]